MICARAKIVGCAFAAVTFAAALSAQQPPQAAPPPVSDKTPLALDAREIIRRGIALDRQDDALAQNYTYHERIVQIAYDGRGRVVRRTSKAGDVTILYGEPYFRLTRKNGKPLDANDQRKAEDKLSRFVAARQGESPGQRAARLAKLHKAREKSRAFVREVLNAYHFRLIGSEQLDGRDCYVIEADPRRSFHSTVPHADVLTDLRGELWIDKKTFGWVKVEAHSLRTISWGLFVVRIHKGAQISIEQARLNHEIWLPSRIDFRGGARVGLFVNRNFGLEVDYSNYQKFTSKVRIVPNASLAAPKTTAHRRSPSKT